MVQDVNEQKEIEKRLVISAIQTLRDAGSEINPYTVAQTAKIPRSTIYRNAELMDLIAHEDDLAARANKGHDSDSVADLEARIQQLDQTIWDLEKQNEELMTEAQNAWTNGYAAGLEEAARRHADPTSEPISAAAAEQKAKTTSTQDILIPTDSTTTSEQVIYSNQTEVPAASANSGETAAQTNVAFPQVSESPAQPVPAVPNSASVPPAEAIPKSASVPPAPTLPPAQPIAPAPPDQAAATSTAPASGVSHYGATHNDGIFNIARSGPYVASDFNPLVELSWKDLETVYNFRVETLIDYGRNLTQAKPSDAQAPAAFGSNGGGQPKLADLIDPDILSMLPSDQEIADLQNLEAVVHMSHEEAEVTPLPAEPLHHQMYDERGQDPNATGDRLQAINDPRFIDGQAVVDLDALDIFDDLDEYVDLDKIHVIEDVHLEQESGDELRELIKGRIQQAAEIQNEQAPRTMSSGAAAAGPAAGPAPADGDAGAIPRSRSKFVGGAKAPQEPKANNFVVRQIPPEIRRACLILGLRPEELTSAGVIDAWKKQIAAPGVHPDHGGDTEAAIYLNTAKDTLVRWIDAQAPKLGKKFRPPDPGKSANPPPANQPE